MTERGNPRIIHVHVPKTGGTSLLRSFQKGFGKESVLRAGKADEAAAIRNMPVEQGRLYRVISAHMTLAELSRFRTTDTIVLVTTRDPIQRLVSFYRHALRVEAHADHAVAVKGLDAWLDMAEALPDWVYRVSQFRYLAPSVQEVVPSSEGLVVVDLVALDGVLAEVIGRAGGKSSELPRSNESPGSFTATQRQLDRMRDIWRDDVIAYDMLKAAGRVILAASGSTGPTGARAEA